MPASEMERGWWRGGNPPAKTLSLNGIACHLVFMLTFVQHVDDVISYDEETLLEILISREGAHGESARLCVYSFFVTTRVHVFPSCSTVTRARALRAPPPPPPPPLRILSAAQRNVFVRAVVA